MPADHRATSSSSLISVADYERAAEACIEPAAFGYYAGGAGDEIAYWNSGRA
jgi:hypothetical protein